MQLSSYNSGFKQLLGIEIHDKKPDDTANKNDAHMHSFVVVFVEFQN